MFIREMQKELLEMARTYPVVTLLGPRQAGKTTVVKFTFPNKPYVNMEDLEKRDLAENDPKGFLQQYPEGAILDEVHRVPKLLSYIQVIVDEEQKQGMYILTGSHQLDLHQAVSQSLAGRTAILNLLPLSLSELQKAGVELSLNEAILKGGYPRIFKHNLDPTKIYRDYFQTYVERDLRQLLQVKDLSQFQKFVRLCAGRIGQLLNSESLSNDVGVSAKTIQHWFSILEASFVVVRLAPYFENFGKRIVKSPKIYFTDVGFAAYLLGIESIVQLERDPARGHLFENLILLELMKSRLNEGRDPNLYFFRDSHGHEIDFIYKKGHQLVPIEVKISKTFNNDFIKSLTFFKNLIGDRCDSSFLIYAGEMEQDIGSIKLINYNQTHQIIK